MVEGVGDGKTLGWIGAGRMGSVLVERLLRAGCDVALYNRTRSKAEPLRALGATLVDAPAGLARRDVVVTIVSSSEDLLEVTAGPGGLLSDGSSVPSLLVDCSTVSIGGSEEVRRRAAQVGTQMLAAPVSGNPKVARAGRLTFVASGPREGYEAALPYLRMMGKSVTYVGEGEAARLVKICHNLLLGVVAQSLAEITVLAERGGVSRADLLQFINDSVMGSLFSRYKTPAYVNLDFTPTFTGRLLKKDLELGLEEGNKLDVPLPVARMVHQIVSELVDDGFGDQDFAALLELEARGAGLELHSEDRAVDDGLSPIDDVAHQSTEGA